MPGRNDKRLRRPPRHGAGRIGRRRVVDHGSPVRLVQLPGALRLTVRLGVCRIQAASNPYAGKSQPIVETRTRYSRKFRVNRAKGDVCCPHLTAKRDQSDRLLVKLFERKLRIGRRACRFQRLRVAVALALQALALGTGHRAGAQRSAWHQRPARVAGTASDQSSATTRARRRARTGSVAVGRAACPRRPGSAGAAPGWFSLPGNPKMIGQRIERQGRTGRIHGLDGLDGPRDS